MATYPKISGNADPTYDLFAKENTSGVIEYDGLTISETSNANVYTKVFTHSTDGHTETYSFIIIKNIDDTAGSFLPIENVTLTDSSGTVVWDGAAGTASATSPVEFDYKKRHTDGSVLATPFVGIQNEANGTVNSGQDSLLYDNGAGTNTFSSSDYFAVFELQNIDDTGVVVLIDDAAASVAARTRKYPIYTVADLISDSGTGGGIPHSSYACIVMRSHVSDITAFSNQDYTLTIKHGGLHNGTASDVVANVTLSMENVLLPIVKFNDSSIADGATTSSLFTTMNYNPVVADGVGSFADATNRDKYLTGDEVVLSATRALKTAFIADDLNWSDGSPVGHDIVTLSFNNTGNTKIIEGLESGSLSTNAELRDGTVQFDQNLKQTSTSTVVSEGTVHTGANTYENFTIDSEAVKYNLIITATPDTGTSKDHTISIPVVSYPCMTFPAHTSGLFKVSTPDGVNVGGWGSADTSATRYVHQNATFSTSFANPSSISSGTNVSWGALWPLLTIDEIDNSSNTLESYFRFNVRLNSHATVSDVIYNGIGEFGESSSNFTGAGFAVSNCSVNTLAYANTSNTNNLATLAYNAAPVESTNAVATPISGLGDKYKEYTVGLVTSNGGIPSTSSMLDYNSDTLVKSSGAYKYKGIISRATGIIDYGSGMVPNHFDSNTMHEFMSAFYLSPPTLQANIHTADIGADVGVAVS